MSLTNGELATLSNLLGNTKSICANGIAQLYLASPDPARNKNDPSWIMKQFPKIIDAKGWVYTKVQGAVVLVIDRELDTFLFQIFDLKGDVLRFQVELYEGIEYEPLSSNFYAFELEDCVAGLNFSDEKVAKNFHSKVCSLKPKPSKVEIHDSHNHEQEHKSNGFSSILFGGQKQQSQTHENKPAMRKRDYLYKLVGVGKQNSQPRSPRNIDHHVTGVVRNHHVGLNPDGTFDVDNIPAEWKHIFRQAGIRKKDLRDEKMSTYIHKVLQSEGLAPKSRTITRGYSKRLAGNVMTTEPLAQQEKTAQPRESLGRQGRDNSIGLSRRSLGRQRRADTKEAVEQVEQKEPEDAPPEQPVLARGEEEKQINKVDLQDMPPPPPSPPPEEVLDKPMPAPAPRQEVPPSEDDGDDDTDGEDEGVAQNDIGSEEKPALTIEIPPPPPTPEPLMPPEPLIPPAPSTPEPVVQEPVTGEKTIPKDDLSKSVVQNDQTLENNKLPESVVEQPSPSPQPEIAPSKPPSFLDAIKKSEFKLKRTSDGNNENQASPETTTESMIDKPPAPAASNPLLEAIREAKNRKLRKVTEDDKPSKPVETAPAFLNEIKTGVVRLRRVSQVKALPELDEIGLNQEVSLLAKLKQCVQERRQQINDDDGLEEDEEDDDDDWSDDGY